MQPAFKWIWRHERSEHGKKNYGMWTGKVPILSIFLFLSWDISSRVGLWIFNDVHIKRTTFGLFYLIQPIGLCVCMYLIQKRYRIKCNNTKWKCCNIQCTDTCLLLNKHCQTMWLYFHVIKKPTTHSAHLQDKIPYRCVYKIERNSKKKFAAKKKNKTSI